MGCKEAKRLPTRRRRFFRLSGGDFVFLIPENQIIQIRVVRKPTKNLLSIRFLLFAILLSI